MIQHDINNVACPMSQIKRVIYLSQRRAHNLTQIDLNRDAFIPLCNVVPVIFSNILEPGSHVSKD